MLSLCLVSTKDRISRYNWIWPIKTSEAIFTTHHALQDPQLPSKFFLTHQKIYTLQIFLVINHISPTLLHVLYLKPHTHTTRGFSSSISPSSTQAAFQMGSRDWFTLSQWCGTWLHDEMVAPWIFEILINQNRGGENV